METIPSLEDVRAASRRIEGRAHKTPVLTSSTFDRRHGAEIFFKAENLQKVGAFKFRGACNAVFSLEEEDAAKGVATHSSGNHAQALALAARMRGVPAFIVMPENSPAVKIEAVKGYGAQVRFCEPTLPAREAEARRAILDTGAQLIHPYDDPRIVAGQGTVALEFLAQAPDLDVLLVPLGGGGLLSGTLVVCSSLAPGTRVIGVEPALADDAKRSLAAGEIIPSDYPPTVADGLRTSLGRLPFEIIRERVEAVVTVSEAGIVRAMRDVFERMKVVIEPSAAVGLAAIAEGAVAVSGRRAGVILSGGNVSLDALPWAPRGLSRNH